MKASGQGVSMVVRIGVAFIGVLFLFGQLFVGIFEWYSVVAGLGGLILAGLAGLAARRSPVFARIAIIAGAAALSGLGVDYYDYHANQAAPGNYYPWFITLPYAAGILFLMAAAAAGAPRR